MITKPIPVRILLIEDDPIIQLVHKSMLQKLGFGVDTTNSGKQALILHRKRQYITILLDLGLSDISGETVLETIRGREQNTKIRIPIIITTVHKLKKNQKAYFAKQANAYLEKPLSKDSLRDTLAACLQTSKDSE